MWNEEKSLHLMFVHESEVCRLTPVFDIEKVSRSRIHFFCLPETRVQSTLSNEQVFLAPFPATIDREKRGVGAWIGFLIWLVLRELVPEIAHRFGLLLSCCLSE
ncbi:MAG: hypothetical protein HW412_705 [Bacteroidetes bacterium]|nr:hypothetical protein [Bacteroidota bacterium]